MEIPDDPLAAYQYAIGKFVSSYASIEATMHQVLRIVSNSSDRDAKVLFSGTRVKSATDLIKRFYEARRQPLPSHLAKAFDQIGTITGVRDKILHNGIVLDQGRWVVTDETKNFGKKAFKIPVSIADLNDLEADSIILNSCLVAFWIEDRRPDLIGEPIHIGHLEVANSPWRYKSPRPMKTRGVIRGTVRERKVQPQPSKA